MSGGHYENPVLQVLGSKKIQGTGANDGFRLLVSDGKHSHSFAMLATQPNDKLITGELSEYSIVRIDRFIPSVLKNNEKGEKRVMEILNLTIINPGSEVKTKLGNPQILSDETTSTSSASPLQPAPRATTSSTPAYKPSSSLAPNLDNRTYPIASLSPYQKNWKIKARVIAKTEIHPYNNEKGEGKLFSVNLCDKSGEIIATAFEKKCDKFYDMIQLDKVYLISHCEVKLANKQYTKNDYEMYFKEQTKVQECEDADTVPSIKYDFVPISEIANKAPGTIVDVIGVCKMVNDVQERPEKSTGRLLKKRDITLVDSSGGAIALTLWGSDAENFNGGAHPVVSVKGAKLTEYNGSKSLSCPRIARIRLNPDLTQFHYLRDWYDNGADMDTVNISASNNEWITFCDAESRQLGTGDKGDYYSLLGVLTLAFSDYAIYKACPKEQCNKKLVDQGNGLFRCEKCNQEYPNYKFGLLLGGNVSDPTGDQRITAFNKSAEAMLGKTSEEIGRMFEYDKKAYTEAFEDIKFKNYVFKFCTKMDTFSDEARLKTIVVNATPIDYKDANSRLLKSITTATGIQI